MALRLARAFATGPDYWMNLQNLYDSKLAQAEIGEIIAAIAPLTPAAA
jgi:antitoxin HigA-1